MIHRDSLPCSQMILSQHSFTVSNDAAALSWSWPALLLSELTCGALWELGQLACCSVKVAGSLTVSQNA
jgi:hypothetical protein